ncbi:MAG: glycosyltransferase, partial [bacterium]
MTVSVVIPAFDAAETIADTLESLLAQTDSAWEAIVIDDGSRDATNKIAKSFAARDARINVVRRKNGGESAARNTGLEHARHEWLLFLDSDDWIAPTFIERMTGELAAHPELDAVHCGWARVAPNGEMIVEAYEAPAGDMFATWARRSAFPVHACVVRKAVVDAVGDFDTTLRRSADWDLWQRVARTGAQFGAVREVLAYYRMRPTGVSLSAQFMLEDGLRVLRRGHSPDPRVAHPHPDHARGAPPEEVQTQEFYLLAWCAGLMIGRGEDARPLLELVKDDHFPDLYPDAIAQCVFDAATLPSSAPPEEWERLWPHVKTRIDEFFLALEDQSLAAGLAQRARTKLLEMIVRHSVTWRPVFEELEAAHVEARLQHAVRIEELKEARRSAEVRLDHSEAQRAQA